MIEQVCFVCDCTDIYIYIYVNTVTAVNVSCSEGHTAVSSAHNMKTQRENGGTQCLYPF